MNENIPQIPSEKPNHEITRAERRTLFGTLKHFFTSAFRHSESVTEKAYRSHPSLINRRHKFLNLLSNTNQGKTM